MWLQSERWIDLRYINGKRSGLYVGRSGLHVTEEDFCTCVGFQFRKKCRHVEELRMIEVEEIVNGKGVREFKSSLSAVNDLFGESAYNSDEIFAYYGMSKIGKSLLCYQEAMWFASQGLNVLYLETEGGMSQFIRKWHDVFVARFGEKKGKVYMVSKKSIETLMEYLGFRVQVVFKSAGGGKKEEKGKLEFKVLETLRDEDVQIMKDIASAKIDVLILDSLSSPLRVFTTDRQSFPAKSDCAGYILRTLAKLQEVFGIAVIVVNHASHDPTNPYESEVQMRGGSAVQYYSKRIVFIDRRASKEFSDYRRFWLVRAEDIKAWSKATVAKITDFEYEDVTDEKIIDRVFTQTEQKKLG